LLAVAEAHTRRSHGRQFKHLRFDGLGNELTAVEKFTAFFVGVGLKRVRWAGLPFAWLCFDLFHYTKNQIAPQSSQLLAIFSGQVLADLLE
jgi:hypothetical protein